MQPKGLITKCKYCTKLSNSSYNGWGKDDSIFGACANGSIGRAIQKDMSDIFYTLVGETRPVATKLMVYLAKTLCTWCTDVFAKFNGNRCIRETKTCECQTMTRGHAVV